MAKWEDQLSDCLDIAHGKSTPWKREVRQAIFDHRKEKFKELEGEFDHVKAEVLSASELAGKIARVCADHERHTEVTVEDMMAGIAAAKQVCDARLKSSGKG